MGTPASLKTALFGNTVRVRDDYRQSPPSAEFVAQRRLSHPLRRPAFQPHPNTISLVLNHAPKAQDVTRCHYNFAKLEPRVRAALQAWAEHVWMVTGQAAKTSNVVQMQRAYAALRAPALWAFTASLKEIICAGVHSPTRVGASSPMSPADDAGVYFR